MRYARLYIAFFRNCLMREMGFRWNFVIRFFTEFGALAAGLVWYLVVYGYVSHIAGWTRYEYLFFTGIAFAIQQAFESLLFVNCVNLTELIRTGELDFYLSRPVSSQFLVSTRYIDFGNFANIFLGIGMAVYAWTKLDIPLRLGHAAMFTVLFINGVIVLYVLLFAVMCLSFWIVRNDYAIGFFFRLTELARQPAEIYSFGAKAVLTFLFPMIVVINFPVNAVIRTITPGQFAYGLGLGALLLALSHWLWNLGLRSYSSASS